MAVIFFFFWPQWAACGILVPQPGIELVPLQWKRRVLTTGPPGKSLMAVISETYNNVT